jgi:3-hydroxypropionyl-CoA synthetase (ADP-forming)
VIISGGFKETGRESAQLEKDVVSTARKYGIRIIGPNCIGVLDTRSGLDSFFQPHDRMIRPSAGGVSFITQSGTVGCTLLEWAAEQGVGISKFASYGNRCDVDEGDLVEYFSMDDDTEIVVIYIEGLSNGRKLFEAASRISKKKPVVVLKAGATQLGSVAARSHTGALGGPQPVALAAFEQAGMIVAHNVEELFDIVKALAKQPMPICEGVVMVTNGAGPVVMAADKFEEYGVEIAKLSKPTLEALRKELPPYCYISETTIDLTGSATSKDYETALRIAAKDDSVGLLASFFVFQDPPLDEGILRVMPEILKLGKPVLCCASGGPYTRKQVGVLENQTVPVYETGERLATAAHALMTIRDLQSKQ